MPDAAGYRMKFGVIGRDGQWRATVGE